MIRFTQYAARKNSVSLFSIILAVLSCSVALAEDWPTYQHDIRRSGCSSEILDFQALQEAWTYKSPYPPQTAWAGPAKWDAYAKLDGLRSMRNYDPCFHTVSVGDSVYFSSSIDDSVHCLDAASGQTKWSYMTDGPVRIAPMIVNGKVYFGSDDGYAYCLNASDASLIWKVKAAPEGISVPSDGKLISLWPCRSGILVDDGIAYFVGALLPWQDSYLCAVDADTGSLEGPGLYRAARNRATMEGNLVASAHKLYVPQGRREPLVFNKSDGQYQGVLSGGGGVFVLLTEDSHIYYGPGNKAGWITDSNAETRDKIATIDRGNCLVVNDTRSYVLRDDMLYAIDRENRKTVWTKSADTPFALILTGETLIAGGDRKITAFDSSNGEELWTGEVEGRAYGLSVANGTLYVSTDTGTIHAFRSMNAVGMAPSY